MTQRLVYLVLPNGMLDIGCFLDFSPCAVKLMDLDSYMLQAVQVKCLQ